METSKARETRTRPGREQGRTMGWVEMPAILLPAGLKVKGQPVPEPQTRVRLPDSFKCRSRFNPNRAGMEEVAVSIPEKLHQVAQTSQSELILEMIQGEG